MMSNNLKPKKITRSLLIYLAISLFFGVPAALISGIWPKTVIGWILIVLFAIPVMITGSFIGEMLFSKKISDTLDPGGKAKKVSPTRMAYAVLIGITYIVLIQLIMHAFGGKIGAHFYFP